jgi:ABC-type antimicrobial peptide transport system permease subunit
MDPDEPLTGVHTAIDEHAQQAWFIGYFAMFYLTFAAVALLLAAVGVYGVVSQTMGERTREFGIRLALGADRASLYRLVLGQTGALVGIGLAIGLAGTAAGTRLLAALLFGANPTDPLMLGSASVLLACTALGASVVPARRAAHVDPVRALKAD